MFNVELYRQSTVRTAQWLCRRHGIQVFPAEFKTKGGGVYWKDICTSNFDQFLRALPDKAVNLAMVFGPTSNVMDIEADSDESNRLMNRLMHEAGMQTVSYQSRRGIHRLFKWEPRFAHLGTNPKVGSIKLDIRLGSEKFGLYSICPPSIHADTGLPYEWLPGLAPWELDIIPVPENIVSYVLTEAKAQVNAAGKKGLVLDVDSCDDGWLPSPGGRHTYLLGFSKLLYVDMGLPLDDCKSLLRYVSQRCGSYYEHGRGEVEINNLFRGLTRKVDPIQQMSATVHMADVQQEAGDLISRYAITPKNEKVPDEIPGHIFPPMIQEASLHAKASGYPRNLWLMNILSAASFALGNAFQVRSSLFTQTTGVQVYSFGVGGSGQGKSRTMKALLSPFRRMESVITDATPEALIHNMQQHPRGAMLQLAEGKEFAPMLTRYGTNTANGSESALFHKTWSGDEIRVIRKSGVHFVESPFLSISAAIQKIHLAQLPQHDLLDGLMQRMLILPLGPTAKKWDKESTKRHAAFIHEWYQIIARLQSVRSIIGSGAPQTMAGVVTGAEYLPQIGTLDPEAEQVWQAYFDFKRSDGIEQQWEDPEHPFRADIVRHAEYAMRIAGLIHQLDQACNGESWAYWGFASLDHIWIPAHAMSRAIDFMEFCWMHKQLLMEGAVEQAFAVATGEVGLAKAESVVGRMDKLVAERKRRIERIRGEIWSVRDYYTTLRLAKVDAQKEIDLFLRERHVLPIELQEGQKAARYKFADII